MNSGLLSGVKWDYDQYPRAVIDNQIIYNMQSNTPLSGTSASLYSNAYWTGSLYMSGQPIPGAPAGYTPRLTNAPTSGWNGVS